MRPSSYSNSQHKQISEACNRLAQGQCVALPTETVYGLAADATNGRAVASIFELKGRPRFNPLICHVDGLEMASDHVLFDPVSRRLAGVFWPGPLTLVLPRKNTSGIHPLVSAELETIGVRCPKGLAHDVIAAFGKPLAAPSANRSGRVSPTRAAHVAAEFPDEDLFILDGGSSLIGLESTIVKVVDGRIMLLRPGAITAEMIEEACGIKPSLAHGDRIEAPGMMQSHYAPDADVLLDCTGGFPEAGWLLFGASGNQNAVTNRNLSETGDLREAAANLYHFLQELDATGVTRICVAPIPPEGLGIAINDRLKRAAAPRENA